MLEVKIDEWASFMADPTHGQMKKLHPRLSARDFSQRLQALDVFTFCCTAAESSSNAPLPICIASEAGFACCPANDSLSVHPAKLPSTYLRPTYLATRAIHEFCTVIKVSCAVPPFSVHEPDKNNPLWRVSAVRPVSVYRHPRVCVTIERNQEPSLTPGRPRFGVRNDRGIV